MIMHDIFRCTLPSAHNNWSPWAWNWWLTQPDHDVIKEEKERKENQTADNKQQAPADQETKETIKSD